MEITGDAITGRLLKFIKENYGGQNKFEAMVGISASSISRSTVRGLGATALAKIAYHCPELDLRWLLTGEGEMTGAARPAVSAGGNVTTIGDVSGMTASPVTVHGGGGGDGRVVESLLDQNRALLEQNRLLTQQLAVQTDTIRGLAGLK